LQLYGCHIYDLKVAKAADTHSPTSYWVPARVLCSSNAISSTHSPSSCVECLACTAHSDRSLPHARQSGCTKNKVREEKTDLYNMEAEQGERTTRMKIWQKLLVLMFLIGYISKSVCG